MGRISGTIENCATGWKREARAWLESLPPRVRLWAVMAALAVFACGCLYMTASAVRDFGRRKTLPEIRHIEKPTLPGQGSMNQCDNLYDKRTGTEKRDKERESAVD